MTVEEPSPTIDEPDLPPALQRLWEVPKRARRGPKAALNVTRIVDAAMEIADAEGLPAVSMSHVAETLGYTTMALYRHVASKDELLVLMTDAIVPPPPTPPEGIAGGWRPVLELWTRAQIEMILGRPWFLDLPLASTAPGPNRLRWIEQALVALEGVDLAPDEKFALVGLLAQYTLGEARVRTDGRRAAAQQVRRKYGLPDNTPDSELDPQALAAADPYADLGMTLMLLADPADYPAVFRVLAEAGGTEVGAVTGPEAQAEEIGFGLDIMLDGIAAFIERRSGSASR